MKNSELAQIFRSICDILEIKNENPFRIRAYRRAAQNIESLGEDIEKIARENKLARIPGIGKDLSERIKEFIGTGRIQMFVDLKKSIPPGLLELLDIPSVGPKTAKLLYEKLGIKDIGSLEKAIKENKLQGIFGIKDKTIENILKGIQILKKAKARMNLAEATLVAEDFVNALKRLPQAKKISVGGSLRRQKETVRDIDILITSGYPKKIMEAFIKMPPVKDILAQGQTKGSVRTKDNVQVDCRVVEEKSFGAALLYFTGSKDFNIKLRQIAIKKGLKLNEYGLFRREKFIAGHTEKEIFRALGMAYIEPELRENTGEIELALKNKLSHLIELKDIKGDLHAHSLWSDGRSSIEEMAKAAGSLGYSYIAITDHSQSLKIARGLSIAALKKKKNQIDKLNLKLKNFRILYAAEVDIDSKGRLDYPERVLKEFDIVVAAIHSGFKQPKKQLTQRVLKACRNKYAHIIAHPTARLWGVRLPYDIDLEEIFKAAKETNTHLEINAFPLRLDLNDLCARRAKEIGLKLAIGTDAHEARQLQLMRFGLSVARRARLSADDVINTLGVEELLKAIRK